MNLKTRYLGLNLDNPLVAGASPLSNDLGKVCALEDAGAAAITMYSLFEEQITIPLAVKLSPFFTALPEFARRLSDVRADGLVLFNRFYQPDFDAEELDVVPALDLSHSSELRLRLR